MLPDVCYEKRYFVENFVKPMLVAMNIGITECEYVCDGDADRHSLSEEVHISFGDVEKIAYVNWNNKKEIVKSIIQQGLLD